MNAHDALSGQTKVLIWFHERGYKAMLNDNDDVYNYAVLGGYVETLDWLIKITEVMLDYLKEIL